SPAPEAAPAGREPNPEPNRMPRAAAPARRSIRSPAEPAGVPAPTPSAIPPRRKSAPAAGPLPTAIPRAAALRGRPPRASRATGAEPVRIVGGRFKGRAIVAPKGRSTRPTSDRARENLFNVLEHADWCPPIEGARVIDLYAGSGALGLEA